MRKHYFIAITLLLFTFSCQKTTKNEVSKTTDTLVKKDSSRLGTAHASQNSLDYIGIYKGILPCADCQGIQTTLIINENLTYTLLTQYLGKSTKSFEEKGTFYWNDKENMIVLNDKKNAPNMYLVGENMLTQLDFSGNKITGSLATNYVLNKEKNVSDVSKTGDEIQVSEKLNNRMVIKTVIKEVNPADGKFTLARTKWRLIELNGKRVKQKGNKIYFIKLNSTDGKFNGYAGCNNFSGTYAMPSSFAISFMNLISTKMACPNMDIETKLIKALETVDNYSIKGNTLRLNKAKMESLAKFEAIK